MTDDFDRLLTTVRKHLDEGRLEEARAGVTLLLEAAPDAPEALHLAGLVACREGHADQGEALLRKAADLAPTAIGCRFNLALVLKDQGRTAEAKARLEEVLALDPGYAPAWRNLGALHFAEARFAEAVASFRELVRILACDADAGASLAAALIADGRPAEAESACRKVLAVGPETAQLLDLLAESLKDLGRYEEALEYCRRVTRQKPFFAKGHWNLALVLLHLGRFDEAWDEWEWRLRLPDYPLRGPLPPCPAWNGEDPAGRTLVVITEQGLGDILQFARYLPPLAARGARIILRCPRPLTGLMRSLEGVADVVSESEPHSPADAHAPLLSLPRLLRLPAEGEGGIPSEVPYLRPDRRHLDAWAARLPSGPGRRVGLIWLGNPKFRANRLRSCPPASLRGLLDVPGIRWFGLQWQPPPADLEALPGLTDLGSGFEDFEDAAAAMAAMDLIVTTDTAYAHLAGSTGRPTWLILSTPADWRWLSERTDSPWYPTFRLFRKPREASWDAVADQVRDALVGWLDGRVLP